MKKDTPESYTERWRTYLKIWMWDTSDEEEMKSNDSNSTDINPFPFYSTERKTSVEQNDV